VNVVDSSAWLEYFADGPNASFFAPAIQDLKDLVVPSICVLEVFRRMMQQRGLDSALRAAAAMQQGAVIDLDVGLAVDAGKVGVERNLPLADSIIFATARALGATVWTQDSDFESLEDVKYRPKQK
jgi:predicted nucleic acid-binding protein